MHCSGVDVEAIGLGMFLWLNCEFLGIEVEVMVLLRVCLAELLHALSQFILSTSLRGRWHCVHFKNEEIEDWRD